MFMVQTNDNTTILIKKLQNSSKQFKTLSKEEEAELINKYRNNRDRLNYLLFMHNIKLVFNLAKRYINKTDDFDGMIQDGMYGLAEACRKFDITKNIKFVTYATWWVKKYILAYFYSNQWKLDKCCTSLNTVSTLYDDKDNENTLESFINEYIDKSVYNNESLDKSLSSNEQVELCKTIINDLNNDTSLSSMEKEIFIKLFYDREKQKNLAEEYSLSERTINLIKVKLLKKLKNILTTKYDINSFYDIYMD